MISDVPRLCTGKDKAIEIVWKNELKSLLLITCAFD
jgi:hypothetical protein